MPASSLSSAFSLGVQDDKDTPAAFYQTALATVSGADIEFDVLESPPEHPGPAARSTARKTPPERVGFLVPVNTTFLLHPRFIGMALLAVGFKVETTPGTGFFTHVFTLADDADVHWMSAIHRWAGDATLDRLITGIRGEQLQINADTQQIQCTFQGVGLNEATVPDIDLEELTPESNVLISQYTGSITLDVDGTPITTEYRSNQFQIAQELDRDDRILHTPGRVNLPRTSIDLTGTIGGINIDLGTYEHYLQVKRRGGANPSLVPATGGLTWTFESQGNIGVTEQPYSITIAFDTVGYDMVAPNANQRDIIRADITYQMLDIAEDPDDTVSITLINDVEEYFTPAP